MTLGGLVRKTDDAQERIVAHERVETGHGDGTVQSVEGRLEHSKMDCAHYRTILPGDVGERTLMESNAVWI
jgi:hypothetical protein